MCFIAIMSAKTTVLGEIQAKRKKHIFSTFLLKKVRRRALNNSHSFLSFADEVKADRNERTHQGYATQSGFKLRTSEFDPSAWTTHSFSSLCSPTVLGHVATIGEMKNRCRSMNRWETSPGWSLENNTGLFSGKEDSKEPQWQHPCLKTEAALPHTKCYLHQASKWKFWDMVCCLSAKDAAVVTSQTCNIDIFFSGMPIKMVEN